MSKEAEMATARALAVDLIEIIGGPVVLFIGGLLVSGWVPDGSWIERSLYLLQGIITGCWMGVWLMRENR